MAEVQHITKICTKCRQVLPLTAFNKRKDRKCGVTSECGLCLRVRLREYQQSPKGEQVRKRYRERPDVRSRQRDNSRARRQIPAIREQQNAYSRKWRKENWEKVKAIQYAWRKRNPDKNKAVHKRHYYKDVEATRARDRARRARKWVENPDQIKMWLRLANHRRKVRKYQSQGECSKTNFLGKCEYHGWRCIYCRVELTLATVTLEHRQPLSRGGSNWPANIGPACKFCNSSKHNKTESEFRNDIRQTPDFFAVSR